MNLRLLPILTVVIIFILLIRFLIKNANKDFNQKIREFKEKELLANSTLKKFENLDLKFITPNESNLPFKEYEETEENNSLIEKQNLVKRKLKLKMLKLPSNLSNTNIKETYGINNFETIYIYEEHFNSYIKSLLDWGLCLFEKNNLKDSELVLKESLNLEGDFSKIYTTLGEIYFIQKNKQELIDLKNKVEKIELSLKSKVIEDLNKKINSI